MDIRQVSKQLDYLSPQMGNGWWEIRAVDNKTRQVISEFVEEEMTNLENIENIVSGITSKPGSRFNIYIGRSPRQYKGGKSTDVNWVTALSLDIDPIRENKDRPATHTEMLTAMEVAKKYSRLLSQYNHLVLMTGNGAQIIIPFDTPVDVRGRRLWWTNAAKKWEDELRSINDNSRVKIDQQYDIPRVVKLVSTVAYKGEDDFEHPYRTSKIEYECHTGLYYPSDRVIDFASEERQSDTAISGAPVIPGRFWPMVNLDTKLYESYMGIRKDLRDQTGSGQDMALVNILKYKGFTKEEAKTILKNAPGGKQRYTDRYADLTINKVYGV